MLMTSSVRIRPTFTARSVEIDGREVEFEVAAPFRVHGRLHFFDEIFQIARQIDHLDLSSA
ncbi:hypothetical protein KX729_32130 [Rhizobium sp. XQZ8]|uniref:hypothetical protein n=1 Tax=Rhizobium populisoli TaxID=2859785 RepID=UPI001CA4FAB6|nr:hypothetical protein [Rhizobium populisoli]MBW6426026.1 hypothetical protein [Rhizobium populisoli]